jgi:hypothetical protein
MAKAGYSAHLSRWSESAVIPWYLGLVRRAAKRRRNLRAVAALSSSEVA